MVTDNELKRVRKCKEDEYILKQEFEQRQKEAVEREKALRQQLKKTHWMHCPKDGMKLVEVEFMGIRIDQCSHCGGIYLDKGEIDKLVVTETKQKGSFAKIIEKFRSVK